MQGFFPFFVRTASSRTFNSKLIFIHIIDYMTTRLLHLSCLLYSLCCRLLQGVMERFSSGQHQQQQVETRLQQLQELQEQIAALPLLFPWPGLTEKKAVVEHAHCLLEKAKALGSEVTALKFEIREQAQLTKDPSWTDLPWDSLENSASSLVKQISVSNFGCILFSNV